MAIGGIRPVYAMTKSPAVTYVHSIHRREPLTLNGGCFTGDVNVMLHHCQRGVAQVLLQQKNVTSVEEKHGRIGVSKVVWVKSIDA